ncbi:MAG: UTP--glucose-1-phosphate uridylyltransferase [Alphaproteobacteria bacterium RIFOXYD12_FULL_60_8]|nr:MAG: UTP--glucose-1-phosphate uridylyltransferase [Alphaproteobacteria bacterium RIFOXYD12_FULL_60_8]
MRKPVRKAVFPVAGLGTRFLPATKAIPKEMLTIVDKPLIQYAVEEAREAGIEEFIFITGRGKTAMIDHFDHSYELEHTLELRGKDEALKSITDWLPAPGQIAVVRQQQPLGLGHAVWCARNLVNDAPFAVILADDLIMAKPGAMRQMMDVYKEVGGNVVAAEDVPLERTYRYGILDVAEDNGILARAKGLVEKPKPEEAPSTVSIIGRYILQPEVFKYLGEKVKGEGGEIQLTDAMARTISHVPFHGLRFKGRRFDCGSKLGFLEANIAFALDHPDMGGDVRAMIREQLEH